MTPVALLQLMAADGLHVAVAPGRKIKVSGAQATVTRWLPEINLQKSALVSALSGTPPDVWDFIDEVEERAAIMQELFPTREAATAAAYEESKVKWRKQ